jgi:hypothetical protein
MAFEQLLPWCWGVSSVILIMEVGKGGRGFAGTWLQFPNLFSLMCSRNVRGENGMWAVSLDKNSNDNLEVGLHSPDMSW